MPRFYFNIRDDQNLVEDDEGMELPDIAAAQEEAEEGAREILAEAIKDHRKIDGRQIEIASDTGEVIATFRVGDLLD